MIFRTPRENSPGNSFATLLAARSPQLAVKLATMPCAGLQLNQFRRKFGYPKSRRASGLSPAGRVYILIFFIGFLDFMSPSLLLKRRPLEL